jgi:hypothetical protein
MQKQPGSGSPLFQYDVIQTLLSVMAMDTISPKEDEKKTWEKPGANIFSLTGFHPKGSVFQIHYSQLNGQPAR